MAVITGTSKSETLTGTSSADTISGLGGNDTLIGLAGADVLDGGDGNDTLKGGAGNDTYVITSTNDVINEETNKDNGDLVKTSVSVNLLTMFSGALEHATLTGSSSINATGNTAGNKLTGNSGANKLDGGDGNDTLVGGNGSDSLVGAGGADSLSAGSGNDSLDGGSGNDMANGGAGNDMIGGAAGTDTVIFSGKFAEYTITEVSGVITVTDKVTTNGNDGTDKLTEVERLQFQDKVITVGGPMVVDLKNPVPGQTTRITGVDSGDRAGISVSDAGDVNKDGFDDVIIGAWWADSVGNKRAEAGESYVLFGKAGGLGATVDLDALGSGKGFTIFGDDIDDQSGETVSSAGDINGDGFDDVIIGAPTAEVDNSQVNDGESYVLFGKATGFTDIDLNSLTKAQGFRLFGRAGNTFVSGAGDVNNDGFDDIIIGAPNAVFPGPPADFNGHSYVIFGKQSGFSDIDLDTVVPGGANDKAGFIIHSANKAPTSFGDVVSTAGDLNGDGFDDLVVGRNADKACVVLGHGGAFPDVDISTLNGGNGFLIDGTGLGTLAVSNAGDINNDGLDDLIIGARVADGPPGELRNNAGASYVVFGQDQFAASINLKTLSPDQGFAIHGASAGDLAGTSVGAAGDVNNDGFADLIIGAPGATTSNGDSGTAYVIYGHDGKFAAIDLTKLTASQGFIIAGKDNSADLGVSVSGAGDVNKDGFDDLIVGSSTEQTPSSSGASYIIYGGDFTGSAALGAAGLNASDAAATEPVLDARDVLDFSGADALSALGESAGESRTVRTTAGSGAEIHQVRAACVEPPADAEAASAL